jgi:hypothetical protein
MVAKGLPAATKFPQRIAQEKPKVLGWLAQDLQGRRKGDLRKARIAARLRRETTLTLEWTAERRCMGPARECQ